jgi:serine/threonine protein phosphatase 1
MRTLVVGDIHGGLRALEQVLERAEITSEDRLIFIGDYVDGWSDAAETVSFLIRFSEGHRCVFLRGNHEELVYRFLKNRDHNPMWLAHGGEATKRSYATVSEAELVIHLQFYEQLKNYYIDTENRLFLHAGFTNMHGPQHEYVENMVYWDRTLWEMVCAMDPSISEKDSKYPKRLTLFDEIYIGHTPVTRIGETIPVNFANVWNVDTGASFKGPLTILDVDTKEFWQSDPVWKLYPGQQGRN